LKETINHLSNEQALSILECPDDDVLLLSIFVGDYLTTMGQEDTEDY
jgi:hypothetical protein